MFFKTKIFDLSDKHIDLSGITPDVSGTKYADYLSATFARIKALGGTGIPCTSVTFTLGSPPPSRKRSALTSPM